MLRRYSNIAMIVAVVAWLGSATAAYAHWPNLAKALIVLFAVSGFVAAGAWVIYCAATAWRWLRSRGSTSGPSAGA